MHILYIRVYIHVHVDFISFKASVSDRLDKLENENAFFKNILTTTLKELETTKHELLETRSELREIKRHDKEKLNHDLHVENMGKTGY